MPEMCDDFADFSMEEGKQCEAPQAEMFPSYDAHPVEQLKSAAPSGKPEFITVIGGQSSGGSWSASSREILAGCILGDDINDAQVRDALSQVSLSGDAEAVYLTLLAWYILEEAYGDNEDEWQLIIAKAKTWLESVGVPKPASFVKKFSLALRY